VEPSKKGRYLTKKHLKVPRKRERRRGRRPIKTIHGASDLREGR
jgi:hypothetical protein